MIERYLYEGAEHAVPIAYLARLLHMKRREVERAIQAARLRGVPICASNAAPFGVYIASTPGELKHYIDSLDRRLQNIGLTRLALGDKLDKMTGQQTMEG